MQFCPQIQKAKQTNLCSKCHALRICLKMELFNGLLEMISSF